jgi:hypothetical protein
MNPKDFIHLGIPLGEATRLLACMTQWRTNPLFIII